MDKVIILGAAGRDFHNFNVHFRGDSRYRVVAFTATQIPDIAGRRYPAELAGEGYPEGIPIEEESRLTELIRAHGVHWVVFSYSDVSHQYVMEHASAALAAGASFSLLGPDHTMLPSSRRVVSITAVRTGAGKSQTTKRVAGILRSLGKRTAVIRHPMPYGDLTRQIVQRFASEEDLKAHHCTLEEREEYEPHIAAGNVVFAGVDYKRILDAAEKEADVIVWDGGNNDLPFYRPDLFITVVDPHRPGHEETYYPGHVNLRMADVLLINKADTARPEDMDRVRASIRRYNPGAAVIESGSPFRVDRPGEIEGKRVLVLEDGPTLTHGDMRYGAGVLAARKHKAREIIDPRAHARGSLVEVFRRYPHVEQVLPAMGYGEKQLTDLKATIEAAGPDLVVIATPVDLSRILDLKIPSVRVFYDLDEGAVQALKRLLEAKLASWSAAK